MSSHESILISWISILDASTTRANVLVRGRLSSAYYGTNTLKVVLRGIESLGLTDLCNIVDHAMKIKACNSTGQSQKQEPKHGGNAYIHTVFEILSPACSRE